VRGDRLLLSRALHSLLVNAIEASPAGGVVEVETGATACRLGSRCATAARGSTHARARVPAAREQQNRGGLGLSLVRDIAAQHRGSVTLVNRDGGGARARLRLPLAE
jgi:signal transduction histidine kinase